MEIDYEEIRRRREFERSRQQVERLEQKMAKAKQAARSAKSRLTATTNSEKWHRMALAWADRDAGFDGEMAAARFWLRQQTFPEYVGLIRPFYEADQEASATIVIERIAVQCHFADWTARGEALLLERAKKQYATEAEGFESWQRANPNAQSWRSKPATRGQYFLIGRIVAALGLQATPGPFNRGEAHNWIEQHGGNPRLVRRPVEPNREEGA